MAARLILESDVPVEDVEAVVRTTHHRVPDSTVREFVPLLVERQSRAELSVRPRCSPGRRRRPSGTVGKSPVQGGKHLRHGRVLDRSRTKGILTVMDVQAIAAPLRIRQSGSDFL